MAAVAGKGPEKSAGRADAEGRETCRRQEKRKIYWLIPAETKKRKKAGRLPQVTGKHHRFMSGGNRFMFGW